MLLSGGTTSLSKLIPRLHEDYVLNARLCARAAGFDASTVWLAVLPLGHNYNLASPGLLGALSCGGRVVLASSTDTETLFELMERERVTVVSAAVPLISGWLHATLSRPFDLSALRVVQNGGARLPPELRHLLLTSVVGLATAATVGESVCVRPRPAPGSIVVTRRWRGPCLRQSDALLARVPACVSR